MPPMPIVKGETEELYNAIAEICEADDFTDASDERPPESAAKAKCDTGESVRGDGTNAASVADDSSKRVTTSKLPVKMSTAASGKSGTHDKPDCMRDKDRLDCRRDKERRRRGPKRLTNIRERS